MTEKSNELSDKDKVTQAPKDEAKGIENQKQADQKQGDAEAEGEEVETVDPAVDLESNPEKSPEEIGRAHV